MSKHIWTTLDRKATYRFAKCASSSQSSLSVRMQTISHGTTPVLKRLKGSVHVATSSHLDAGINTLDDEKNINTVVQVQEKQESKA
jgi:hypothetical protein